MRSRAEAHWRRRRAVGVRAVASAVLLASATPAAAQDTLVVRANDPPIWGESVRLVEELRIGRLDGAPEYTFGRIGRGGVVVLDNGEIWVTDQQVPAIRRFAPGGAYVGDVGRRGEGPGEFQSIEGLDILPNGRVAVWDPRQARATLFEADGEYSTHFEVGSAAIRYVRKSLVVDTAGRLWIWGRMRRRSADDPERALWRRYAADGERLDSVVEPPKDLAGPNYASQSYGYISQDRFAHVTLSHPSPHGYMVAGRNEDYVLYRPLPDGRVVRIERQWSPVSVKPDERVAVQRIEDHFAHRRGVRGGEVPERKPPYWHLWVDRDGRIWVARYGEGRHVPETAEERERRLRYENPPNEWWEDLVFDVIEPTGRFLGTVRFPNRQTDLQVARDERVWVIERGEFGEQYLVRYRIEGS